MRVHKELGAPWDASPVLVRENKILIKFYTHWQFLPYYAILRSVPQCDPYYHDSLWNNLYPASPMYRLHILYDLSFFLDHGAESNITERTQCLLFVTRRVNPDSQSYADIKPVRFLFIPGVLSSTCGDVKSTGSLPNPRCISTDYVWKAMKISDNKSTIWYKVMRKYFLPLDGRVLKRNYSIFFNERIIYNRRNDVCARAHTRPILFTDFHSKDVYYFSNALHKVNLYRCDLILAYFGSNFKSNQVRSFNTDLDPTKKINRESFKLCVYRLSNIKFHKYSGKYINLTKSFLTDPSFLFLAYNQIKSKRGNTTPAVDSVTFDGIQEGWFVNAADQIKYNKYVFKPARRVNLPKPNSAELRSLTVGSPRDKIIQQALYTLLDHIYEVTEKIFLDSSHGSRRSRSPHTAMKEIKRKWTGLYWFIETDISKAFDTYHRNIIINSLKKVISDQRLIDLIRKMFKARILSPEGFYFLPDKGIPQGNVLSPFLSNVYLHELDKFMEGIKKKYDKGSYPTVNKDYQKLIKLSKYERSLDSLLQENIRRYRRKTLFNRGIKPYLHDGNYIRVRYIRYVDDILIGVRGPKKVAMKIKTEMQNWLKSNLHLNLKEEKTQLTYCLGNKINFLGFSLYGTPYDQLPYRNSRRIEKRKRVRARILALKEVTKNKLKKFLRTKITKYIASKIGRSTKISERNHFIEELSSSLIQLIKTNNTDHHNFRDLLRTLENKLTDTILEDTNEKIKELLGALFDKNLQDDVKIVDKIPKDFEDRGSTLISKSPLSQAAFARKFTECLKREGFQYYSTKNVEKIRFDEVVRKFIRKENIKLTYFPANYEFPDSLKAKLFEYSEKPKRGSLTHNYKTLVLHFQELQKRVDPENRVTLEQSQSSKARIDVLESNRGTLSPIPLKIKVDWKVFTKKLVNRGFLNKNLRPGSVSRILSLNVADIIKHFNQVLVGYLSFFRCVDDFSYVKKRLHWYFRFSLVSTLKAKFKLGGRNKVFEKYSKKLKCLDLKNKEVSFVSESYISGLKREFLTEPLVEDPDLYLNKTWISTTLKPFAFDQCAVKGCNNKDIEIHHVRNLHRADSNKVVVIEGKRKKLKGWEALLSAQRAKQLPLCSEHHKLIHTNNFDNWVFDPDFFLNQ